MRYRRKRKSTIDKILIFCATMLIIFTLIMIFLFIKYQAIPDTLVSCFFVAFGIETVNCVILHKDKKKREDNDNG